MPRTIDVTGLSEPLVQQLQGLVDAIRTDPEPLDIRSANGQGRGSAESSVAAEATTSGNWPGPPPDETPEQWVARFRAWAESHPKRAIEFDDSRESIYEGCGE